MMPIAIFFHAMLSLRGQPLPLAEGIIRSQWQTANWSGLTDAADYIYVGMNEPPEDKDRYRSLFPPRAIIECHGSQCFNELRTLMALEKWARANHGWQVLSFHSKGASKSFSDTHDVRWRNCMMDKLITNWKQCVTDLVTHQSVGCHWMTGDQTPPGQSIWAGNFWWATTDFLATRTPIVSRARIKISGLDAKESRHEAEVLIGNGPFLPKIKDYCPQWTPGKSHT